MLDLQKIKLILWDFDDTLCFHSDHRSPKDEFDTEYNVKVLLKQDPYATCSMNYDIKKFMNYVDIYKILNGIYSINIYKLYICIYYIMNFLNIYFL